MVKTILNQNALLRKENAGAAFPRSRRSKVHRHVAMPIYLAQR